MGVRKRKSRYGLIASLVATLGLVLSMMAAPASATSPGEGKLEFEGTAHLPVFPDNIGSDLDGHFYGQVTEGTLEGTDPSSAEWAVEFASDPLDDNDLYAQFDYAEPNCELGTAEGSVWFYLANQNNKEEGRETDTVIGTYDINGANEDVTSVYVEGNFTWTRTGNTANITLSGVNVWLNGNVTDNYDSEEKGDDHPDVIDHPGVDKGHHVIVDHNGLGQAAFAPLNPEFIAEACPENATAGDLHAEVVGSAEISDLL